MKKLKKIFVVLFVLVLFFICGCADTRTLLAANAAGKNLDLSGYLMFGKLETVNPETAAPEGRLILGRLNYKSRLVAVDKNKQIPTAGAFRAIRTVSLFGTEETIIEYDFTAANAEAAGRICMAWEAQKKLAENIDAPAVVKK